MKTEINEEVTRAIALPAEWEMPTFTFGQEVCIVYTGVSSMITGMKVDLIEEYSVPPCATWMYQVGTRWWSAAELSITPVELPAAETGDFEFDPFLDADDLP